jgi:hypothetical protein
VVLIARVGEWLALSSRGGVARRASLWSLMRALGLLRCSGPA